MSDQMPSPSTSPADHRALLKNAVQAINDLQAKLDAAEQARHEPVAIIGLSCRYPGAKDPDAYWSLLHERRNAVGEVPLDRWDVTALVKKYGRLPEKWYGGFLEGVDQFDPEFFGISPREANTMDPQQRLVLEVAWEALERAGVLPEKLLNTQTGMFLGITTSDYARVSLSVGPDAMDVYTATGSALNVAAGRVAYTLGLHGPCMAVDTACSSSLTALHLACQSLRNRECELALTGGVNVMLTPEPFIMFSRWGMMAPDGLCKTFDAAADGFVRSEGCGMLVLKRLSDALADGDPILALIRGSAVNEDGKSSGLTVPNGLAQQAVIRSALAAAQVKPSQIQYVETHGTGTTLGDPIEVEAIGAALGEGRTDPLTLGSVKTNIGHCESAAGVAGIIKTVLSLVNEEIPGHLHFKEKNPRIPWPKFEIRINSQAVPWQRGEQPRLAGVSSFGFSGVNAHVVLEEAPVRQASPVDPQAKPVYHLLAVSARSQKAAQEYGEALGGFLAAHPEVDLADAAHTLAAARTGYAHRLAVAAATPAEAAQKLANAPVASVSTQKPRVAFLFTGQGAQYSGMARQLFETEPIFRAALERCDRILQPLIGESLLEMIYPQDQTSSAAARIDHTRFTQPALFAIEYALTELWRSWGVTPQAVMGHSVGEYAAACAAGVFSLEDGLKLIAGRGRLMGSLPAGGQMAVVFANRDRVESALIGYAQSVAVGAYNGPETTVISGAGPAVEEIVARLAKDGVSARPLTVSHAFHSPLMDPILDDFAALAGSIPLSQPALPLISNNSARPAGSEITQAEYWREHIRQPVRFSESVSALRALGCDTFIEIGPNPTLLSMAQRCLPDQADLLWLPSLRKGKPDQETILTSLGELYCRGGDVHLPANQAGRKISLPTYPFQRDRYWIQGGRTDNTMPAAPTASQITGPVRVPQSSQITFSLSVSAQAPEYLADHRIHGMLIFPGSGYLGLAIEAARRLGWHTCTVSDFSIYDALVVPEHASYTVQISIQPEGDGRLAFEIFSVAEHGESPLQTSLAWKKHAAGMITAGSAEPGGPADLGAIQESCPIPLDPETYYHQLRELGLEYGPTFRGLQTIWQSQSNAALGRISLGDAGNPQAADYAIHPGVLDACFQVIGAALPAVSAGGELFMPVGLERFEFLQPTGPEILCHVQLDPQPGAGSLIQTADLSILDSTGVLCARIHGLRIQRASQNALRRLGRPEMEDWFYQVSWQESEYNASGLPVPQGRWLVLADQDGVGHQLAAELLSMGAGVQVIEHTAGITGQAAEALLKETSDLAGVLYLWGLDAGENHPLRSQEAACGDLVQLTNALSVRPLRPKLWVLTRLAQPAGDGSRPLNLAQSTLWGLGRTIAQEYPEMWGGLIDLDTITSAETGAALIRQVLDPDGENQIAYRAGKRFTARLARLVVPAPPAGPAPVLPAGSDSQAIPLASYELAAGQPGSLEGYFLRPADRVPPSEDEVEVRVIASGLNFRDVINALGMYSGQIPLGNECTGLVTRVGKNVRAFQPGDAVIALGSGTFRSYLTTRAAYVFPMPKHLSYAQTAAVPTAFLTAWFGLNHLANLQPGQRVLIHAAAGGVGLAAVQAAQRAGAEVFATAGSPMKQDYLRSIGVQHIYSSRQPGFTEEILRQTGGQGVHVVLNSLTDEFIPASLDTLAPGGVFLEIGKRGIWSGEKVAELYPGIRYHIFDLAEEIQRSPDLIRNALCEILDALENGQYSMLPTTTFPLPEASQAFRYMAQARHIGKIALTHPYSSHVQREGTYLITGGTGGLGLQIASSLVSAGAGALVLVSRSAPTGEAAARIAELSERGTKILVHQADVSSPAEVDALMEWIRRELPSLRGIIHAAGIIDDGALIHQDWERFARVLAPKAGGAWNLHLASLDQPLDFFILFSAGAGLFGSAGQSSYAAANAFLDALVHHRRALGLPALSINWGPWAEVGMAAQPGKNQLERWEQMGVQSITPQEGQLAFELLGKVQAAQAAVMPIRWDILSRAVGDGLPPFLKELAFPAAAPQAAQSTGQENGWLTRFQASKPDAQRGMLDELVRAHAAGVLGLKDPRSLDPQRPLIEMGLDSLMSVEFCNRLRSQLGYPLPSTVAYQHPTIAALVDHLDQEVRPKLAGEPGKKRTEQNASAAPAAASAETDPAALLQQLNDLPMDEVDRLLRTLNEGKSTL